MSFFTSPFNSPSGGVFIRKVQLIVLPLAESLGGGDIAQAIVFSSSGKEDDFRISFRVTKYIFSVGSPDTLEVTVYNLSEGTKQLLSKKATNVTLQLGYEEGLGKLIDVATGGIASVTSSREGADVKTTVFNYDGLDGLAQAVSQRAYQGNTTLKSIVHDLASDIPGVETSELNIKISNQVIVGTKGRVLSGRTSDILSKLADQFGFNWTVQQGVFKAVPDNNNQGNIYEISTAASNLISATPRIDNIGQVVTTIDIETVLDPRINPGDLIDLKSEVNPTLTSVYQATFVSHIGDTHGDVWQTNIQCVLNEDNKQFNPTSANSPAAGNVEGVG